MFTVEHTHSNKNPKTHDLSVVGIIMDPRDVHVLVQETCDYVTSCGKRNFADVIKGRILRRGDYFILYGGPNVVTSVFICEKERQDHLCLSI